MTDEVKTPAPARYHCPHLGLHVDPTVMLAEPTADHRCFAAPRPATPTDEHQQHFCLSPNHVGCPFYREPAAQRPVVEGTADTLARHDRMGTAGQRSTSLGDLATPPWRRFGMPTLLGVSVAVVIVLASVTGVLSFRGNRAASRAAAAPTVTDSSVENTLIAVDAAEPTVGENGDLSVSTSNGQPEAIITPMPLHANDVINLPTVTLESDISALTLAPTSGNVSWWSSNEERRSHVNDSFLYAGFLQGETYISAMRFDLSRVPRGAEIRQAQLSLSGLRADRFAADPNAVWWVEVLAEEALPTLGGVDFLTVFSAPSSLTLAPFRAGDLAQGAVNPLDFDSLAKTWLEQQLINGAKSITVRVKATTQGVDTRFGWDSGQGPESNGRPPQLLLSVGPPPPTPPPIPTKPQIVATASPIPANVLTVVALNETATYVATATGTNTPVPWAVVTPTPFPANLETVQAVVHALGVAAVVPHTPTPGNEATAIYRSAETTAVAQTTGTNTPVPTGYVTPILIYPSPPAENILTAVARETQAAGSALLATPTPVPFNGVFANYVVATVTPVNVLTAAVMVAEATANAQKLGTPQPTPWNQVVIMPTPLPVSPTATPTPPIEALSLNPTSAPTTASLPPIEAMLAQVKTQIIFKTTRNGVEETFALNPATNQLSRIHDTRVYPLVLEQLPRSPDGLATALVEADDNRLLQIRLYSSEYGTKRQVTAFGPNPQRAKPASYDPAWSPRGDLIAFVTNNTGNDEIFTVDLEGQLLTQLTFNRTEWDKHPTWSPDGSQIVFFSNRDLGLRRLWIMNADGSGQREISSGALPAAANPDYEDWDPIWVR